MRTFAVGMSCVAIFIFGLTLAVAITACAANDANQPEVVTYTVNGTVKVVTTGP
jgi:hypothetical protein